MNCLICLSDFENKKYTCNDPRCTEYMCHDCMSRYIEISKQENRLLLCPRENCKGVYHENCLSRPFITDFRSLIFNHYKLAKGSDILDIAREKTMYDMLKEERSKFFVETMPKMILKTANIAFKHRLVKVKKTQLVRESKRITRTCINIFCKGFLNENLTCVKCNTTFCKQCEDPLNEGGVHECDKGTVDSVTMINALIPCPSCGVKIEKGEGCMAITCAVCKTNFWYTTGEKGHAGNHGKSLQVHLHTSKNITLEYKDFIPSRECFKKIQEMETLYTMKGKTEASLIDIIVRLGDELPRASTLAHFSEIYTEIVDKTIRDTILGKKLMTIEKILMYRKEGYEKELEALLLPREIQQSRIVSRDGRFVFTEDIQTFVSFEEVEEKTGISAMEIKKCIEIGNKEYKNYYWDYV